MGSRLDSQTLYLKVCICECSKKSNAVHFEEFFISEIKRHGKKKDNVTSYGLWHEIVFSKDSSLWSQKPKFPSLPIFKIVSEFELFQIFSHLFFPVTFLSSSISMHFCYVRGRRATDLRKCELCSPCVPCSPGVTQNTGGPQPDPYLLTWHQTREFHYENWF